MSKSQYLLKTVGLPLDLYKGLITMDKATAGDFIQHILQYAMDGTRSKLDTPALQPLYEFYELPITEQIASAKNKSDVAKAQARERQAKAKQDARELKQFRAMQKDGKAPEVPRNLFTDVEDSSDVLR